MVPLRSGIVLNCTAAIGGRTISVRPPACAAGTNGDELLWIRQAEAGRSRGPVALKNVYTDAASDAEQNHTNHADQPAPLPQGSDVQPNTNYSP